MRILGRLWAFPYTLIGLTLGLLGILSGGQMQQVRGVWEFHGGLVSWLLRRLPLPHVAAMTLGHTILGRDREGLDITRDHEHVHVRQYERWGPLFGLAYLGCSFVLWCRGRDWYRENPFEREAWGE